MPNWLSKIFIVTAWLFISSTYCCADDMVNNVEKDMCLLDINNCVDKSYYNIVEKIKRLKIALKKGLSVYSPSEITHLENVLDESYYCVERIEAEDFIDGD
jgi:hypothetical protein